MEKRAPEVPPLANRSVPPWTEAAAAAPSPHPRIPMIFPRLRGPRIPLCVRPLALAVVMLLALAAPAAQATTVVTTPGESFTSAAPKIYPVVEAAAIGGKALAMYTAGTAQAVVKTTVATTSISFIARGTQCLGAPSLQMTIDGVRIGTWSINTTYYAQYGVTKSLAAGTHTITVALVNDYGTATCDRNAYVDAVSLVSTSSAVPVTPPKLRWPAPPLTAPTTIAVPQGDAGVRLDTTKDYILNLGSTPHHGILSINGGRNVVIKGGTIALPLISAKMTGLFIANSVGIVHVEGVLFDGSLHEMDAIQISAPAATVQIQNVRATGIFGSFDTNHSDVIQPWGGVKALRVDRLSADSNYQGIFTRPDQGAIGSVSLQNVDLSFNNAKATATGGFLLWMTSDCKMAPTTLSSVYVTPRSGKTLGMAVWPATSDGVCPSLQTGNTVTFPALPVTGSVIGGAPPAGAFVPAGKAGTAYVSPGYQ
jgi:hypothetical protein